MPSATTFKGSKSGKIRKSNKEFDAPKADKVLVRVSHSGLCGTDEHYKTTDMVLGHEGIGIVEKVGSEVTSLREGDRVGWGYCHGRCGNYGHCLKGEDLYCHDRQLYGDSNLHQGSFGTHVIWPEKVLIKIPQSMQSVHAAPLMCAGAAVYSAIANAQVTSSQRVGVVGVGGLGHLAIQFLTKMGCEVIALSRTGAKKQDAEQCGAAKFFSMEEGGLEDIHGSIDTLILTSSSLPPWDIVLAIMKRGGVIMLTTADMGNITIPNMGLLVNALQMRGSLPAPRWMTEEMLKFAAFRSVKPVVEVSPLEEEAINTAMERLRRGKVRFRVVFQV